MIFYYDKRTAVAERITSIYSVSDHYLVWGELGVIAWVVYAVFLDRRLGRRIYSGATTLRMHEDVRRTTLDWLCRHGFPWELCEPFK